MPPACSVAVAPKAEVGISGTSLLFASPRAKSIRLVDASMTIRIDTDGRVNVMVGGDQPFATIAPVHAVQAATPHQARQPASSPAAPNRPPPGQPAQQPPSSISLQALAERGVASNFTALLGWIDRLGGITLDNDKANGGFDGQALTEIGITNGSLTIDDRRNGQEWKFQQISLWLNRPRQGGATLQRAVGKPATAMGAERGADTRAAGSSTPAIRGAQGQPGRSAGAASGGNPASLRYRGVGVDPIRHCRGRHATDRRRLGDRTGRLDW